MSKTAFFCLFLVTNLAAGVETVWTYDCPAGYIDTSPGVGDVNGDGRRDLVVVTTVGSILALDADGTEMWRYDTHERLSVPPTVADVTGGPGLEVVVLANSGQVFCLEGGSGSVLWQTSLPGMVDWGRTGFAAADITGNGSLELVAADSLETLTCMTGAGKLVWSNTHPGVYNTYPAVADVNGDGYPEVLAGAMDSPLVCISHEGKKLWQLPPQGAEGSTPVAADLTGDGVAEILVGIGNGLAAVDGKGEVLWTFAMRHEVDCAIAVADADGDGAVEVYAVDLGGKFVCLTPDGGLKWEADVEQRVRRNPAIADVDGDGVNEILVAGYSSKLYVFDPKGLLEEAVSVDGDANATPTVVDFNGDGWLTVVLPLASGFMHAFRWGQKAATPSVLVPEFRVSSARTGAPAAASEKPAVAISEMDCGKYYVGANQFSVSVKNDGSRELEVEQAVLRDGVKFSGGKITSSETEIPARLIYTFDGAAPATLTFVCTVRDGGKPVAERRYEAYLTPFTKELADLGRLAEEIEAVLPKLASKTGPENVLYRIEALLPELKERAMLAGTVSGGERMQLANEFAQLRETAARMAAMVKVAAGGETTLAAYAANPWAAFGGADELAEGGPLESEIQVSAFGDEIESAAVNLYNFSDSPRLARVYLSALKQGETEKEALTAREVVAVPTQMLDLSWDALPLLNEGRTVTLPPWEARQVWLTVDAGELAAGDWQGQVEFRTLDVDSVGAACPVSVKVFDSRLPEEQPLRLCHWGYVHTSVLKDQPEAALEDQVEHRTNVFVGLHFPEAACDEDGNIVGEIDFTAHDEYVKRHAPHGIILFFNYQRALKGAPQLSDGWKKAHIEYLRAWVAHLAELGVGYDGFALYPVDEPGLNPGLADRHVAMGELAREADPKILLYTDPVGSCTMEELKAMAPYVDIWCPNRNGYLIKHNADKLAFIRSTGARVWTYECIDNAKHQSPLGYYRGQAWLAWHYGLTGIGFWSYCTSRFDPWYRADKEYLLIYQGDGVVPSKRWEAVRDGVEDYAMLTVLKAAADKAQEEGRAAEAVAEARKLLGETATEIGNYCGRDRDDTAPGPLGPKADRAVALRRWKTIQGAREKIAALLQVLQN